MFISKNEHSNPFILFLFQMWVGRKEHFRFVMYISAKKTYSSRSTLESGGEIRVERRWRENCVGKQYRCGKSSIMKIFFLGHTQVIYLGSKALHIIGVWDSKIIGTMHYWSIGRLVFSASSSSSSWLHLSRQATSCGRGDLARQFPLGYRRAAVNRIVPPALVHNLYSPLVTACQGLNLFWCCQ